MKTSNDYSECLGMLFALAPKHVLAAVAVSFAARLDLCRLDPDSATRAILTEWEALHANGIVPQKPAQCRAALAKAGVEVPRG